MGKNQMKRRVTLQKQFVISFILIVLLSIITSLVGNALLYNIYDKFTLDYYKRLDIIAQKIHNNIALLDEKRRSDLKKLIGTDIDFYIKDKQQNIIYESQANIGFQKTKYLRNPRFHYLHSEISNNPGYHHLHSKRGVNFLHLPIFKPKSEEFIGMLVLVLNKKSSEFLNGIVEIIIPFASLALYTFVFAKILSCKMKKPLKELMNAVTKIKNQDLDFTVVNDQDNEIGDLARAFEEMRNELKNSLLREWQLEQDRRDMVAVLTHDLRTPLAVIQGHIERLQDIMKDKNQEFDGSFQTIANNIYRVKNLVDEMNVLVEVESVNFDLKPKFVNLKDFFEQKINDLKVLAAKKGVTIEMEFNGQCQNIHFCFLDPNRLAQVIDNIVGNSLRFTPKNGFIKISVAITEIGVNFKICDNGPGFLASDLPNLFKKFYKSDSSRSMEKGHSGLGLYITKLIIVKHGGTIQAVNWKEGGACIDFSIKYLNLN